jgi:hypothetical protein
MAPDEIPPTSAGLEPIVNVRETELDGVDSPNAFLNPGGLQRLQANFEDSALLGPERTRLVEMILSRFLDSQSARTLSAADPAAWSFGR